MTWIAPVAELPPGISDFQVRAELNSKPGRENRNYPAVFRGRAGPANAPDFSYCTSRNDFGFESQGGTILPHFCP